MKRPQNNFVVEYKRGSRRQPLKPTSIWGNLDLKSISRDVQADAASNDSSIPANRSDQNHSERQESRAPLTAAQHLPKTGASIQEEHMAEESLTVSPDGVAENNTSPAPEPKKRRGPRAKSQPLDAASDSSVGEPAAASKHKTATSARVKKTKADTSQAKASAKQPRKPRGSKPAATANFAVASGDEFADLLQLEEENRSLRKQLAEKLRTENADLRRRLGHS